MGSRPPMAEVQGLPWWPEETMDIQIERVGEHNVEQWVGLIAELAKFEHLPPPGAEAKRRLRADALASAPRFEAYLAASSARTVGCLTLFSTYSTFRALPLLYIEDIFVLEAYRRRGVGQALFDFCLRLASERGCARLEWNVLRWNEAAVRFYAKNNATRVDDWVWYRRDVRG